MKKRMDKDEEDAMYGDFFEDEEDAMYGDFLGDEEEQVCRPLNGSLKTSDIAAKDAIYCTR